MNAKTSRFGGIPLPTKQWGEDTPTVRSWELHIESRGSICEVESQSITARDLKYLNDLNFQKIYNQAERTAMVLGGLIRSTRKLIIK